MTRVGLASLIVGAPVAAGLLVLALVAPRDPKGCDNCDLTCFDFRRQVCQHRGGPVSKPGAGFDEDGRCLCVVECADESQHSMAYPCPR